MTKLLEKAIAKASELGGKLPDQKQDKLAGNILEMLENLEDAEELRQAKQEEDELIPWEQVVADYKGSHPEADV